MYGLLYHDKEGIYDGSVMASQIYLRWINL